MNRLSLALVFALTFTACGDDDVACIPGAVCACADGEGDQTCRSDGSFGSCICFEEEPVDAGEAMLDAGRPDAATDTGTADTGTADTGSPDVPVIMDDNCDDGTCVFVSRMFDIPRLADFRVYGENLDDEVTRAGDPTGCGKTDFLSALDATQGVDNAIANLVPLIDGIGSVSISSAYANALVEGELLMVIKLEGVDGADDESVDVSLWYGMILGTPTFDDEGLVDGGQTIAAISPVSLASGTIVEGRFRAVFTELPFSIGLLSDLSFVPLLDARVSAQIEDSTLRAGMIAGSLDIDALATAMARSPELNMTRARELVVNFADIRPVEGICQELSLGAFFESVHAREESRSTL